MTQLKMVRDTKRADKYGTFKDLLKQVDELILEYPHLTYDTISFDINEEYSICYLDLEFDRPQTEKEREKDRKREFEIQERERAMYETLKKKFG